MASSSKDHIALVIEVQSSSVQASVVDYSTPQPETLCSAGITLAHHASLNSIVKPTMQALRKVIDTAARNFELNKAGKTISSVQYVLSSPWILSQAHTVSVTFPKNTKVTQKVINTILNNRDLKPKTHVSDDWANIERKVLDVSLNGYPVSDWNGKTAKSVDVVCLASVTNKHVVKELTDLCHHVVPARAINFHSALVLQYIAGTQFASPTSAQVCVNVHDDITDVISVSKQQGIFFGSFPIGHHTITSRVAEATKTGLRNAASLLTMHSDVHLDASHSRTTIRIIEQIMNTWKNEYSQFMKLALPTAHTPSHIFVFSEAYPALFARSAKSGHTQTRVEILPKSAYISAIHTFL